MTTGHSTYTYESGAQETVTLRRGPLTPRGHAVLKIAYSDGQIVDCYVNTAWLRDRLDDLDPRPLTADDLGQMEAAWKAADNDMAPNGGDTLIVWKGRDWWEIGVAIPGRPLDRRLARVLHRPPARPEGAEEVEAAIRQVTPSHPEDRYADLADKLAEHGVRVTGKDN